MAITWTIIVLGALLHDASTEITSSTSTTKSISVVSTSPTSSKSTNLISTTSTKPNSITPTNTLKPAKPNTTLKPTTANSILDHATLNTTIPNTTLKPTTANSILDHTTLNTTIPNTTLKPTTANTIPNELKHTTTSLKDATPSVTALATTKEPTQQPSTSKVTTQITTIQPTITTTNTSPTDSSLSSKSSTSFSQDTTSSNKPATTTHKGSGTSPDNQTDPSAVTTNPATESTSTVSQSIQQETQTTSAPITSTTGTTRPVNVANRTSTSGHEENAFFDLSHSSKENVMLETCKKLGQNLKGNCSVTLKIEGKKLFATVTINADQTIPTESYKPLEQKEEVITDTLIAILASSGALVLILCCFAAYCTYHRRSYRKNQQHLTEELQTVENGYHDNPTLEVMEVQPEMQEKKLALNGEFNDSWIVPIDNLLKEDIPDEEDTHL